MIAVIANAQSKATAGFSNQPVCLISADIAASV
jgi:hypothetical protein